MPSGNQHLVDAGRLELGDVLLTRGRGLESAVIAWAAGGRFSHAALVADDGQTTYESDGYFISHRIIERCEVEGDPPTLRLGEIPGRVRDAAVYRHPEMHTIAQATRRRAMDKTIEDTIGYAYPPWSAPLGAARARVLANLAPALGALESRFSRSANVTGDFCSQLVARFYANVGLSLFASARAGCKINPNDLAESQLMDQGLVVTRALHLTRREPAFLSEIPEADRILYQTVLSSDGEGRTHQNFRRITKTSREIDDIVARVVSVATRGKPER